MPSKRCGATICRSSHPAWARIMYPSRRDFVVNEGGFMVRHQQMMKHHEPFLCAVISIFLLGGANRVFAATSDACSLLTVSEVSAALEISSLPGKPAVADNPKLCMWSDAENADLANRRVTLSITSSTMAFDLMKSSPRITTEAVAGIGDEAFFEIPKGGESPILQVRKGSSVLTLRILNGLKSKPFNLADVKAKEAALAKAAAGRF